MSRRRRKSAKGTAVIIRYEGPGKASRPDWDLQDIIAIFPNEAADVRDWRSMTCYSSVGQHSSR